MRIRRWVSPALITVLLIAALPATTRAAEPAKARAAGGLQGAIARAAGDAATKPSLQLRRGPANPGVRQSGGGHTMAIVSIVGTLVGTAATVYAVKEMQKSAKKTTGGS
ncbi:MAG TPA: hypothetical protein VFZ98_07590 [Vicinamibacterales bacterium]